VRATASLFSRSLSPSLSHAPPSTHTHLCGHSLSQGHLLHRPGAVRAFRCQLPRDNPFYPPVPAGEGDLWPRPPPQAAGGAPTLDRWRVLQAEAAAAAGAPPPPPTPGTHLYPEAEVVVEDESSEDEDGVVAMAADQL